MSTDSTPTPGLRILPLGTGSAFANTAFNRNCNYLVRIGNGNSMIEPSLLVDCSDHLPMSLQLGDLTMRDIQIIANTHFHFDHAGGLQRAALTSKYMLSGHRPRVLYTDEQISKYYHTAALDSSVPDKFLTHGELKRLIGTKGAMTLEEFGKELKLDEYNTDNDFVVQLRENKGTYTGNRYFDYQKVNGADQSVKLGESAYRLRYINAHLQHGDIDPNYMMSIEHGEGDALSRIIFTGDIQTITPELKELAVDPRTKLVIHDAFTGGAKNAVHTSLEDIVDPVNGFPGHILPKIRLTHIDDHLSRALGAGYSSVNIPVKGSGQSMGNGFPEYTRRVLAIVETYKLTVLRPLVELTLNNKMQEVMPPAPGVV
jgi:ribonuclease BN (tRNA processing enzyme)